MDLLDQISSGKDLAVTGANGERAIVDLRGAGEAVPRFRACFGEIEPDSAAAASHGK